MFICGRIDTSCVHPSRLQPLSVLRCVLPEFPGCNRRLFELSAQTRFSKIWCLVCQQQLLGWFKNVIHKNIHRLLLSQHPESDLWSRSHIYRCSYGFFLKCGCRSCWYSGVFPKWVSHHSHSDSRIGHTAEWRSLVHSVNCNLLLALWRTSI